MRKRRELKGYYLKQGYFYVRKTVDGYQESFGLYKKESDAKKIVEILSKVSLETLRKLSNLYKTNKNDFYKAIDFHPEFTDEQVLLKQDFDLELNNEIENRIKGITDND